MLRKIHSWAGVLTVLAFVITGQLIRHHQPPVTQLTGEIRLLLRSRHIYILASGLVNLMLGLYLQLEAGWRGVAQSIGSGLVLVSPVLLIVAFATEPERGFQPEMPWSTAGLFALYLGCMVHLVSSIRKPHRELVD